MPPTAPPSADRRAVPADDHVVDRILLGAVVLLIAWGTLAFGAVYPWAYVPLFAAAALLGLAALWRARAVRLPRDAGLLVLMLIVIGAAGALQLVPLTDRIRNGISPATESFLRSTDVGYSAAVSAREHGLEPARRAVTRPLSLDPVGTRRAVLMLVALTILLAGLLKLFGRIGVLRLIPWIIGFGVLVATVGIVQKALLGDHAFAGMKIYGFWAPRYKLTTPFGPFVNKNHYAGWMVMALPLAIGYLLAMMERWLRHVRPGWRDRLLWLSSPQGGRLQLVAFAIVFMGSALALAMSRSGIGCFVVAALLSAFAGLRGHHSMRARIGFAGVLLALMAIAFVWADVDVARRFTSGDQSIQLRRDAWRDAVSVIRDFPLVGTGLNTYGTATLKYKTAETDMHFREAHNDYLQLAAEGGLLIGIPALLGIVFGVRAIRQRFAEDARNRVNYWLRFGATMGLLAIALQSAVEFSLQMPGNAVLFVVLCATALHQPPPTSRGERPASPAATAVSTQFTG